MSLCKNRADGGQGTYKGDLTTCTEDSFIVPLPALVLCIGFIISFAMRRHYPGEKYDEPPAVGMQPMNTGILGKVKGKLGREKGPSEITSVRGSRSGLNIGLSAIFVLFMAGLFALNVLEMTRLDAGMLGIGILPLVTVGLFLATLTMLIPTYATNAHRLRARPHYFPWTIFMILFLGGMAVVVGVKVHTLYRTETLLGVAKVDKTASKKPFTYGLRKLLNIVMCALYSVSFMLYLVISVLDRRDARRA